MEMQKNLPPAARPGATDKTGEPGDAGKADELAGAPSTRQEEWRTFLFLAYVMAPALAVVFVGGYGFSVWMFQLFTGQLPTG
jgi:periplasmic nitrate reductase NapE